MNDGWEKALGVLAPKPSRIWGPNSPRPPELELAGLGG